MDLFVASRNPAKIASVRRVFNREDLYNIIPQSVPSGVGDQPFSDVETRTGAVNRAKALVRDFRAPVAIGLEGGVTEIGQELYLCNWGALATAEGDLFIAAGARVPLPEEVASGLRAGKELGDVIDTYAEKTGVRYKEGTIGILTAGAVARDEMFAHIVRLLYGQWQRSTEE
ncbi:DUF84 family protein [Alteribacter natronophilus]|uniref:DUF84 family protein n=1 Tax=Alteribacter natronophilus TaxID=2583810 RepID=UPI00110E4AE8|nr:DUF84 family protein [Alteribacter natronophilus]TMW71766.1 DUF84 family protein [Alteribacter natronophilus]